MFKQYIQMNAKARWPQWNKRQRHFKSTHHLLSALPLSLLPPPQPFSLLPKTSRLHQNIIVPSLNSPLFSTSLPAHTNALNWRMLKLPDLPPICPLFSLLPIVYVLNWKKKCNQRDCRRQRVDTLSPVSILVMNYKWCIPNCISFAANRMSNQHYIVWFVYKIFFYFLFHHAFCNVTFHPCVQYVNLLITKYKIWKKSYGSWIF